MTPSAVCVGDNCVDFYLPPINQRYIGGNAVNVAVYLKRAGIPSSYVGVVGDDHDGKLTLKKLLEEGVDVTQVQTVPGRTATTHIQLSNSGERQFVYEYLGPRPAQELDTYDLEFISRHKLVHNTMSGGTGSYLPRFRQIPGLLISMDFGERSHPDFIRRSLPYVDLAFFSMDPDMQNQAEALALEMFSSGRRLVVVTLGTGGSLVCDGKLYYQPAIAVDVVDTLGAGDAYIGTFLAYWLRDFAVTSCMQLASLQAAETCTHLGGWTQSQNPGFEGTSPERQNHYGPVTDGML
jgi:fructoselysine 6-kinase